MADKTFVVTHSRARAPLTISGKTLQEALEKEGLDPTVWKPVPSPEPTESPPDTEPPPGPDPD